ncbi:MAG: Dam family site-specific DNA-(adenine-N6)-methyltransferase [Candidatus Nitrosoabyssus spongiisocia]|nr:MAG: Dam family site-specific DNA-(adenine-N6)-methyltransferase [Nitrosopumilaceae archaeon AB1(1)]
MSISSNSDILQPIVKWAGGKRQIISELDKQIPSKYDCYFEPFLGGWSLLFHILSTNPKQKCHLFDLNKDLITTYQVIRNRIGLLIKSLTNHYTSYSKDPKNYYYKIRDLYPVGKIEIASKFLFLNKTCYNGLYRVNSDGHFNVPFGRYKNPNIINEIMLRKINRALRSPNIQINCNDFTKISKLTRANDFIYFDPPYFPIKKSSFTSYTEQNFNTENFDRLVNLCDSLDKKNCKVLLSNSNVSYVSNAFSKKWKKRVIRVNRFINSDSARRLGHTELLIQNY